MDIVVPTALTCLVVLVLVALHAALRRPLWYDEIWRPHFLSQPWSSAWSELAHANTPSALGWALLVRAVGALAGWHAWALRLPELAALAALPVVFYTFARRFTGVVAAGLGAAGLGLSGVVVDLGTQLKPYSIEALSTVVIVWLWTAAGPESSPRRRFGARGTAGIVSLFSVPAAFLVIPLAAADLLTAGRAVRRWPRAIAPAVPALAICGLHTVMFVGHQSSQRASQFWDTQFLAGRGLAGGLRFVATEALHILSGAPTGVDRYDPNLVHPVTDTTFAAAWLLAPATAVALVAGAVALARRADGRRPLAAVVGALVLALAASAGRYWPFGANRTNLFLVPLLVLVVATGADRIARVAFTRAPRATPRGLGLGPAGIVLRVPLAAAVAVLALSPLASASALRPLWRERADIRPVALMIDATALTRRMYQPGDVVVVGGRLARSGWLYAMEVSDDGAYLREPAVPGVPATGARVPDGATVFLTQVGAGEARRAIGARPGPVPTRVLLFVLVYDRSGAQAEIADLGRAGYCPQESLEFPGTGTLNVLTRCPGVAR